MIKLICAFFACTITALAIDSKHTVSNAVNNPTTSIDEHVRQLLLPPLDKSYRLYNVFGQREVELRAQAILNNKVLIHDKWYKRGDKIGAYFVQDIGLHQVVLVDKKSNQKILTLKQEP